MSQAECQTPAGEVPPDESTKPNTAKITAYFPRLGIVFSTDGPHAIAESDCDLLTVDHSEYWGWELDVGVYNENRRNRDSDWVVVSEDQLKRTQIDELSDVAQRIAAGFVKLDLEELSAAGRAVFWQAYFNDGANVLDGTLMKRLHLSVGTGSGTLTTFYSAKQPQLTGPDAKSAKYSGKPLSEIDQLVSWEDAFADDLADESESSIKLPRRKRRKTPLERVTRRISRFIDSVVEGDR